MQKQDIITTRPHERTVASHGRYQVTMAAPGYQCFCGFDTTPTSCTNITRASTDGGDEQARASYREAESNVTEGTVYHDVNAIKENFAETLYEAKEGFVPVSVAVLVPDQPHRTSPSGKGNR